MIELAARRWTRKWSCSWSRNRAPIWLSTAAILTLSIGWPAFGQPEDVTSEAIEELMRLIERTPRESSISISDTRRLNSARLILESEPENPTALRELGLHHAMNYRWYANFIAAKQPIGGGLRGTMEREYHTARDYLERAIDAAPDDGENYAELVRLTIEEEHLEEASKLARALRDGNPGAPDGWLMGGLIAQLSGDFSEAERLFSRGLSSLDASDARLYRTPLALMTPDEFNKRETDSTTADATFWRERDPILLTPENERLNDHLARLVYTDLWYGSASVRGWETERGAIVARYGVPTIDYTFTGGMSRFNVLDYDGFDFLFEDQTRGGHFTMFSPKASAGSSWDSDYVIKESEMALSMPERFEFADMPKIDVVAEHHVFRRAQGGSDVYSVFAIPMEHLSRPGLNRDQRSKIGGFLLDETSNIIDSDDEVNPQAGFYGLRPYATGSAQLTTTASGLHRVSVEFLNHDRSAYGSLRDSIDVPVWDVTELGLSSILFAEEIDTDDDPSTALATHPGAITRGNYHNQSGPLEHRRTWTRRTDILRDLRAWC